MRMAMIGRLALLTGLAWQGAEARAQHEAEGDEHHSEAPRHNVEAPRQPGLPFRGQGPEFRFGGPNMDWRWHGALGQGPRAVPGGPFLVGAWWGAADDALGLTLVPIPDRLGAQLSLPTGQGLIVSAVEPDGPAARVGLRINDILLSLNEKPLFKPEDFASFLKEADAEKPVQLSGLRRGKSLNLKVRRVVRVTIGPIEEEIEKTEYVLGVAVSVPDEALRAHLEIPEGRGLVVDQVVKGSAAEKGGIQQDDVLLSVAGKPLDGTAALVEQVREAKDKPTELRALRDGKELTLVVTPEKRSVKVARTAPDQPFRMWMVDPANPNATSLEGLKLRMGQRLDGPNGLRFRPEVPGAPDDRIDKLEGELKSLREAIDGLKDAMKSVKDHD